MLTQIKMQKSTHIKNRSKKKIQTTCLSIQRPLAFSIELKPNSHSHNISPTSASQNLRVSRNANSQEKKKRVTSAQVSNASVRILPGKSYTNWSLNNSAEKSQHNQDIKWIGVYPNPKNSQVLYNQAFPKRQQRNADQSLANFMLRYGRFFKNQRQGQSNLKNTPIKGECSLIFNAATVKVKPRLTWFGKRRNSLNQKTYYEQNKPAMGVVWWKNKK